MGLLLMGVAGSGKSTVGAALAQRHETDFLDADSLHNRAAMEQMHRGQPLTAGQRNEWIASLVTGLRAHPDAVVACSALKREHREQLRSAGARPIVWLQVSFDEIARRLKQRQGHFVTTTLLASQLDDLEMPTPAEGVISVDGDRTVAQVINQVEEVLSWQV